MVPSRSLPQLMEELVEEILLRLPSDDPACLVRASLVCKPWRRLLSGRAFLRRYRAFHRTPPLVGFFRNRVPINSCLFSSFVPTASIPRLVQPAREDWNVAWVLDCRHGRVLLETCDATVSLVVCDPITGDRRKLPSVGIDEVMCSGVVFCAVDGCDHVDCHGGPFRVAFIASSTGEQVSWACLYSSETNAWSTLASVHTSRFNYVKWMDRGVITGDDHIYFPMFTQILKYDWRKHRLSVMTGMPDDFRKRVIMLMEDGSLGLAGIRGSSLHLWSREVNTEGVEQWVQYRSINLENTVPGGGAEVIGFAEGVNIILLSNGAGTFVVELKSGRVRKVDDRGGCQSALPYLQFYTPDLIPAGTS